MPGHALEPRFQRPGNEVDLLQLKVFHFLLSNFGVKSFSIVTGNIVSECCSSTADGVSFLFWKPLSPEVNVERHFG